MNLLANLAPLIGIFLLLAGVPGFALLYNATKDLPLSLGLFGLYELVVIVGGIFTKVWTILTRPYPARPLTGGWAELRASKRSGKLRV